MELFSDISQMTSWISSYLLPFLFVLTIVVFFHELGHYLVARWNDVDVSEFSVGFGPELFGFNDRNGTRWKLSAIPLGGYVKFMGDANAASQPDHDQLKNMSNDEKAGSFEHKRVGQRAAVVAAGPIANFILAILIFTATFYINGRYVLDPLVGEVVSEGAAEDAGILPGDMIKKIDGVEIESFSDIPRVVGANPDQPLSFEVDRGGELLVFEITPRTKVREDRFGNVIRTGMIGIVSSRENANLHLKTYNLIEAAQAGAGETWFIISRTMGYLGNIITGREAADQLGGPIRIAKVSGDVATLGITALINLAAVLSVSIGLLNLFPIPMLDGGHLVFYAFEVFRGKPASEKAQEIAFRIGLALVLMLMVFTTWNDVTQPWFLSN